MLEFEDNVHEIDVNIKILGIGGGGGNIVNTMVEEGLKGVEFFVLNTDRQALKQNQAINKIQIGENLTRGLGVGGIPEKGRLSALENREEIKAIVDGTDLLFITAGMGGGTGTGGAPVVAEIARELGVLTVAVVTTPFINEGVGVVRKAEEGLSLLEDIVDSIIVINNENFIDMNKSVSLMARFKDIDKVLYRAINGIYHIINGSGYINLDFSDIHSKLSNGGKTFIKTISARFRGKETFLQIIEQASKSSIVDNASIENAGEIIIAISCKLDNINDTIMHDTLEYVKKINNNTAEEIKLGIYNIDEDIVKVTIIATKYRLNPENNIQEKTSSGLKINDYIKDIKNNNSKQKGSLLDSLNTDIPAIIRNKLNKLK